MAPLATPEPSSPDQIAEPASGPDIDPLFANDPGVRRDQPDAAS